ncbi:MAG: hypothetical protein ACYTFN_10625 [Planctomycetota bacterium]
MTLAAVPVLLFVSGMVPAPEMTLEITPVAQTQVDPQERSVLFVRGADGSGGATEGGTKQQRTEQLGDINNNNTNAGNHGYGTLRALLVKDGFTVTQLIESATAITLATLQKHRVVVFGSNNKVYSAAEIKAFHDYVDRGGSALFISDANWGLTWEAAPASDNGFLARYGAQVYQDSGQLPLMTRSEKGRYLLADHPVLSGPDGVGNKSDVNRYNGEGVSLFRITKGSNGFQAVAMVSATGLLKRLNNPTGKAGIVQAVGAGDAAMIFAEKGNARIVGHFDRNTFFNQNGAGTDILKLDNAQLALNIFRYLASVKATATAVGKGCGKTSALRLLATPPILGRSQTYNLTGASAKARGWFVLSPGAPRVVQVGNGCQTYVDLSAAVVGLVFATDTGGGWTFNPLLPESHALSGVRITTQVVTFIGGGPFGGGGELSNGVDLVPGFPR